VLCYNYWWFPVAHVFSYHFCFLNTGRAEIAKWIWEEFMVATLGYKSTCEEERIVWKGRFQTDRSIIWLLANWRHLSDKWCILNEFLVISLRLWLKTRSAIFLMVDCVWNAMAHAQKPDFVFRRNGRVHLNWRGRQLSRLLAAEVCASAVVMLDTTCSQVVWRVLATHSIRQFPLHFPSRASPCAITFHRVPSRFNWTLAAVYVVRFYQSTLRNVGEF
jgi:hypothetical protein